MGWNQRDAVGEPLQKGDFVKIFRYSEGLGHTIVGEHLGEVVEVVVVESENYTRNLQICLYFGSECGWAHQSSVMKV